MNVASCKPLFVPTSAPTPVNVRPTTNTLPSACTVCIVNLRDRGESTQYAFDLTGQSLFENNRGVPFHDFCARHLMCVTPRNARVTSPKWRHKCRQILLPETGTVSYNVIWCYMLALHFSACFTHGCSNTGGRLDIISRPCGHVPVSKPEPQASMICSEHNALDRIHHLTVWKVYWKRILAREIWGSRQIHPIMQAF